MARFLVPFLAVYLDDQQIVYSAGRIIEDGIANRKKTILQNGQLNIFIVSSKMYVEMCVSVYDMNYYTRPEQNVEKMT